MNNNLFFNSCEMTHVVLWSGVTWAFIFSDNIIIKISSLHKRLVFKQPRGNCFYKPSIVRIL